MDGINAGRKTIPFARFDKARTNQGLECLLSCRTEWDEKARAFKKTPDHNWASHGADGWASSRLRGAPDEGAAAAGELTGGHPPIRSDQVLRNGGRSVGSDLALSHKYQR
jgi:hypothetical protein